MIAIDAGADDISVEGEELYVYGSIQAFETIKKGLEQSKVVIKSSNLEWVNKESKELSENAQESLKKLLENLEDLDDVNQVYTNAQLS
jgi:transcriptional/translational regulatory protein YebC/TACO1